MLFMKESLLSLKGKQHNIGFPTFKLPGSTKSFMTDLLNIIFDVWYMITRL